jgi:FkbM family methyltransferase
MPSHQLGGRIMHLRSNTAGRRAPWLRRPITAYSSYTIIFLAGLFMGRKWEQSASMSTSLFYLDSALSQAISIDAGRNDDSSKKNDNGWKTMEMFVGSSSPLAKEQQHNQPQHWFSQCRQDEVVLKILGQKRGGYFIDLAANDATTLSNTYALEQAPYQWTGLCIEPNPLYWYNLTTMRNCQVVSAVVGKERDQAIEFEYALGDHGGITGSHFNNQKRRQRSSNAYTVPLQEILERMKVPKQIDYFSLDVEGAEEFILEAFDLSQYQVSIWTIERPSPKVHALLASHGYQNILRLSRWGENLFVHERLVPGINMTELEEEFSGKAQWDKFKREKEAAERAAAAAATTTTAATKTTKQ